MTVIFFRSYCGNNAALDSNVYEAPGGNRTTVYYVGDVNAFDPVDFTLNHNLFNLGIPTLKEDGGAAYTYSADNQYAGLVTAEFPTALNINQAETPTPTLRLFYGQDNRVQMGSMGMNNNNVSLEITGTLAGGRLPVNFSTDEFPLNITTAPPTGAIKIKEINTNESTKFSDSDAFGYFFKGPQEVTITGQNTLGDALAKIEYLFSDTHLADEAAVRAATGWLEYNPDRKPTLQAGWKGYVYALLTDTQGKTAVISAGAGIVVYTPSEAVTTNMSYTKFSNDDRTAEIALNGNTITGISDGTRILMLDDDYTLSVSGEIITFTAAYLDALAAGEHTLTVSYNPMGVAFVEGGDNDAPIIEINLNINLANQAALSFTPAPNPSYTYGDTFMVAATGGTTGNTMTYASSNTNIATVDASGQVSVVGVGTFTVTATMPGNENYNDVSVSSGTITAEKRALTIDDAAIAAKTFDGTTTATVNSVTLSGAAPSDSLELGTDFDATGTFDAATAGTGKTVTVAVTLTGAAADNYSLTADTYSLTGQSMAKANSGFSATPPGAIMVLSSDTSAKTFDLNTIVLNQTNAGTRSYTLDLFDGDKGILNAAPTLGGTNNAALSYQGAGLNTGSATQEIHITTDNYENISVAITFMATDKLPQSISFAQDNQVKTYGDAAFYNIASGGAGTGAITYSISWSYPSVATVGQASGLVTIVGAGSATITAIKAECDTHMQATASYTLTVNKASIIITAEDKQATLGAPLPPFTWRATGLASGETLATEPTLESPTADMNQVGSYPIIASAAVVPSTDNYEAEITYWPGTLTVGAQPGPQIPDSISLSQSRLILIGNETGTLMATVEGGGMMLGHTWLDARTYRPLAENAPQPGVDINGTTITVSPREAAEGSYILRISNRDAEGRERAWAECRVDIHPAPTGEPDYPVYRLDPTSLSISSRQATGVHVAHIGFWPNADAQTPISLLANGTVIRFKEDGGAGVNPNKFFQFDAVDENRVAVSLRETGIKTGRYGGELEIILPGGGTDPVKLAVSGRLTISVNSKTPTLKATAVTINTFYNNRTAPLVISGAEMTHVRLAGGASSSLSWARLSGNDMDPAASRKIEVDDSTGKASGTLRLEAKLAGWGETWYKVDVKVSRVYSPPALRLANAKMAVFMHPELARDNVLILRPRSAKETLAGLKVTGVVVDPDSSKTAVFRVMTGFDPGNGVITVQADREKGEAALRGSLPLLVSVEEAEHPVKLNVSVSTVKADARISLRADKKSLSLNPNLNGGESATINLSTNVAGFDLAAFPEKINVQVFDGKDKKRTNDINKDAGKISASVDLEDNSTLTVSVNPNAEFGKSYIVELTLPGVNVNKKGERQAATLRLTVRTLKESSSDDIASKNFHGPKATLATRGRMDLSTGAAAVLNARLSNYNGQITDTPVFEITQPAALGGGTWRSDGTDDDFYANFTVTEVGPNSWEIKPGPDAALTAGNYGIRMVNGRIGSGDSVSIAKAVRLTIAASKPRRVTPGPNRITLYDNDPASRGVVEIDLPEGFAAISDVTLRGAKLASGPNKGSANPNFPYIIHQLDSGTYAIMLDDTKPEAVAKAKKSAALTLEIWLEGNVSKKPIATGKVTVLVNRG